MGDFFRSVKFKIILCMIALFTGIMLYSVTRGGNEIGGERFFVKVFEPVWILAENTSQSVKKYINICLDAESIYEENKRLHDEIGNLNKQLVDYENTKDELQELKKFVGIKEENPDFTLSHPCSVISHITNDPYGSFVIDSGSSDEIELYDPVVTSEGLVGVITSLSTDYSIVTTILSPDVSIGAIGLESKDTGVIEGSPLYAGESVCKMIYIDKDANTLRTGEYIVTSGEGGLFPKNYPVGKVKSIDIEENGLSAFAEIEPFVDFSHITSVMVITDFDGKGDFSYDD